MVWSSLGLGGDVGSVEEILNLSRDHHLHVHVVVHCQTEEIQHNTHTTSKTAEVVRNCQNSGSSCFSIRTRVSQICI